MMKKTTSFFCWIALISVSCSPRVVHYVNDSSPFKSYETFVVVNYKINEAELSPEGAQIFDQITTFINLQMSRRGYQKDQKNPDLIVRYELISNQVTEMNVNHMGSYSPFPRAYFSSRTFLESALLVEITDHSTKKLVWQASIDLNKYSRKKDTDEILRAAAEQLFNTYLYRAGTATPDESLMAE